MSVPASLTDRPGVASVPTAAAYLDCHPATIRKMIASGVLPATRIGQGRGTLRIRYADLDAVLRPEEK